MKISVASSALADLEQIKAYYLEQGVPHVGEDFVVSIIEHIQTLAHHPDIGRVVPEFGQNHIRELIHSPYRVVYMRESKRIQIVRVWRSERLMSLSTTEK